MTRMLLLCLVLGGFAFMAWREPPVKPAGMPRTWQPTDTPVPAASLPAPTAIQETPSRASVAPTIEAAPLPLSDLVAPTPAPRKPQTVARPAKPVQTSPIPEALRILEPQSAGLPNAVAAAPRLSVDEILSDGTVRNAGGPSGEAPMPPLARRLPRVTASEAVSAPTSLPAAAAPAPTMATVASPRPTSPDVFLKNAARILAETELPR